MLNYKTTGSGKKQIFFVHGNSQSLETWNEVVNQPSLSENYTLIAIDLPGHGDSFRSKDPKNDYSLKGMAIHLKEFISGFNKQNYIIVANSLGANLVGEIAADFTNCKGIMLTGSSAIGKNLTVPDIIKPNPNVTALFMPTPTEEQIDLLIADVACNLPEELKTRVKNSFAKTDPEFRTSMAEAITNQLYSDELLNLEKSKIPVAVVFGAEEKLCFTDYLDKIPFTKWKNKTFLIENSGHFSQLDQPQVLTELINEFAEDCFK